MNKQLIKDELIKKVDIEIKELEAICDEAKDFVQTGDLKSDGKYDTRSIEASYLASAQLKRLEELKLERKLLEEIPVTPFKGRKEIAIGDLVQMKHNKSLKKYYLSTTSGGAMLKVNHEVILVISVFSPLGSSILGANAGDQVEVELTGGNRIYEISSAY